VATIRAATSCLPGLADSSSSNSIVALPINSHIRSRASTSSPTSLLVVVSNQTRTAKEAHHCLRSDWRAAVPALDQVFLTDRPTCRSSCRVGCRYLGRALAEAAAALGQDQDQDLVDREAGMAEEA
jgi:hypothetical protein